MLVIRDAQIAAFACEAERKLHLRILEHLRREYAETVSELDEATLLQRIVIALAHGRARGVVSEPGLTAFTVLMFVVGPAFHEHPRISELLNEADPEFRMELLLERLTEEDVEQAHAMSRGRAWDVSVSEIISAKIDDN